MNAITEILNWISSSLLLPVIVLLLTALAASMISLGGFSSSCLSLLRQRRELQRLLASIRRGEKFVPGQNGTGVFARHLTELANLDWDDLECEKRITEFEMKYEQDLERSRFMMKIGPMLGLMGTLIPMGPALAGLASGDIGSMAYNMRIAFATTVVGCFVAGVGLLVYSVKRHWYAEEISNLRYILERQLRNRGK